MKLNENNIDDELKEVSDGTLLNMQKSNVFEVPDGYFATLPEKILNIVLKKNRDEHLTAQEEIIELSPTLAALKDKKTWSVPSGYFETFSNDLAKTVAEPEPVALAPVRSINTRKPWLRYAAAAAVIGLISLVAVLFSNNKKVLPDIVAESAKNNNIESIDNFNGVSDGALSQYLSDTPGQLAPVVDSTDENFYNVALLNVSDKDLGDIIHQMPDEDLISYEN
ncbi:MAG: hypothetical protein QM802_26035 [Agriterribacter sp.]